MSSFIRTDDHITIVFDNGENGTVYASNHHVYDSVLDAIRAGNWDKVYSLAFPAERVKKSIQKDKDTRVQLKNGVVYFEGEPLHTTLTDRMVEMVDEGLPIRPLSLFLINLMDNPSYRAVNELYDFLEASDLPITEDGHFLAYKRIRDNYMDIWSGKMDNSIGTVVAMPRNRVDENKDNTCSDGLHFCARGYLPEYGTSKNNRTVIVKINPKDVVSIPSDYNNAKGRCCRYEVVSELEHNKEKKMERAFAYTPTAGIEEEAQPTTSEIYDDLKERITKQVGQMVLQIDPETEIIMGTFPNAKEAAIRTKTNESSIRKVCAGTRKTANKWKWKYQQAS